MFFARNERRERNLASPRQEEFGGRRSVRRWTGLFNFDLLTGVARSVTELWDRNCRTGNPMTVINSSVIAGTLIGDIAELADKGYHYQFVFARNAGHADWAVRMQTLPEALEYVWQGYSTGKK